MRRTLAALPLLAWLGAAGPVAAQPAGTPLRAVASVAETQPTAESGADIARVLVNPADRAASLILGSGEAGGIEIYDLSGKRRANVAAGDVRALDLRDGVPLPGKVGTLVVALDGKANAPRFFAADVARARLAPVAAEGIVPGFTTVGLCLARSHRDGDLYLFLLGAEGGIEQWLLTADPAGMLRGRLARRMALGSETGYCAADDRGSLYVSQEAVGVWRLAVEPESEVTPEIVDIIRLGHISGEAKGVAIAPDGRLVVSDASANRLNLYDPAADHAYLGSVSIGPGARAIDAVTDAGGVSIAAGSFGAAYPDGLLAIADDDNGAEGTNFKLVSYAALLAAANVAPRAAPPAPAKIAIVRATVETQPVETGGDAADDPAIWIDPADPARSVVIGTQKQSGLYVYDLAGKVIQFLADGRMNNVDLRAGFRLNGRAVTLVTASDRTHDSIAIYTLDPATRMLTSVADGVQKTGFTDPYGLCMYRSARSGRLYVFVTQTDGKMRQWELVATSAGKVRAKLVRDMPFASQVEGCVADDETGMLYVGEEDAGLWRQGAEPKGGAARTMFAAVKDNPALKDDMEGIGLYALPGGKGYLVVSSQGNDSYAVFRREGHNAYVGSFAVAANGPLGIDGISETDGLEVTSLPAGPAFPHGLMIAQDGRNVSPQDHQNFKLVPWEAIAAQLSLERR